MAKRPPKVSIGLPVYNGDKYLPNALRCLMGQDYEDFELIICDNASTDGTEAICREFAAKDGRIQYFRNQSNIGASGNYNRVFQLARGEFFKWASHDDECYPSLVRRCLETFAFGPASTVLVYSQTEIIDGAGQVKFFSPESLNASSPRPCLRLANVLLRSSYAHSLWGVIRSDALRWTRLMGSIEADHVLLHELALLGELIEIPEVLYRLRVHPRNATNITRTPQELLAWHDPTKAQQRVFLPHWERVYIEYLKAVRRTPLSGPERLVCFAMVPLVSYWRRLLRWSGPFRHRIGLHQRKHVAGIRPSETT